MDEFANTITKRYNFGPCHVNKSRSAGLRGSHIVRSRRLGVAESAGESTDPQEPKEDSTVIEREIANPTEACALTDDRSISTVVLHIPSLSL